MSDFERLARDAALMRDAISRRTLVKGVAAGVAGLALAQLGCGDSTDTSGSTAVQDILDATTTVEQFGVTFLGAGIASAQQNGYDKPWPDTVLAVVQAARAQEQAHLDFYLSQGGKSLNSTFTIPPLLLTSFDAFFAAIVEEEALEVAAQIAAMGTFAGLKRPDLAKFSFQYAAEEAEHRLLANYTRGVRPANDNAFSPKLLPSASAIIDSLKQRGLIGGTGTAVAFPGPGTIDTTNLTNPTPDEPAA